MTTCDQRKYLKLEGPHSDAQEALIKLSKRKKGMQDTKWRAARRDVIFENRCGWNRGRRARRMGEKLPLTQVGDERREKVEIITCASACTRKCVHAWGCQCKYTSVF